jgi:hypothetical protein
MDWWVTICALIAGGICFVFYIVSASVTLRAKPHQAASDLVNATKSVANSPQPKATAEEYSKLLEAASKLTDSLSKAGPTLVSLIGAILFFLIAAVSSGALKNAPPAAAPGAPAGVTAH